MKRVSINVSVPTWGDVRSTTRAARGGLANGLTRLAKRVEPAKPKKKAAKRKEATA